MDNKISKIIDYEFVFESYMKYFCSKSCFKQLLDYYGVDDSLLYVKVGFYLEINKKGNNYSVNSENLFPASTKDFIKEGFSNDFDEILKLNEMQIRQEEFPVLSVDTYYLPYRSEFNKIHASHAVILAGMEEDGIYIIDYYPPHYFKGKISKDDFLKSRVSINPKDKNPFSGVPIKNYWYSVDKSKVKYYLETCILNNFKDMLKTSQNENEMFRETALLYLYSYYVKNKGVTFEQKKMVFKTLHDSMFVYYNSSTLMLNYLYKLEKFEVNLETLIASLKILSKLLCDLNNLCIRGCVSPREHICASTEQIFVETIKMQKEFLTIADSYYEKHIRKEGFYES